MYYEVIWENGEVSVADYTSDDVALAAITAQHDRAKAGATNGPQGGPATRVARVLKYKEHPGSLYEDGGLSADVLTANLADLVKASKDKNGVVNVLEFAELVKTLVHPMIDAESPHDSRFKMKEDSELDLKGLV